MAQSTAKRLARAEAREKRRAAQGEVTAAKFRVGIGFGGTYLLTQVVLPIMSDTVAENQEVVDGVTGLGLGALAIANDGPIGDFALGGSLVGAIQTLDNIGTKFKEWQAKNA